MLRGPKLDTTAVWLWVLATVVAFLLAFWEWRGAQPSEPTGYQVDVMVPAAEQDRGAPSASD